MVGEKYVMFEGDFIFSDWEVIDDSWGAAAAGTAFPPDPTATNDAANDTSALPQPPPSNPPQ